jgi:nucleoside phosphorylase
MSQNSGWAESATDILEPCNSRAYMQAIDVLIITALQEEHDAARDVATATPDFGVAKWEKKDRSTSTPYLVGKYAADNGLSITIALARPARMGSIAIAPLAASLVERLKPQCLAMCGVCAGNPDDMALGDVIIAEMVYQYDEGKRKENAFEADHRQLPMSETWVRAAQDLVPDGLSSFGEASDQEAKRWLLERLLAGDKPKKHPAYARYFPRNTWARRVRALEKNGLVVRNGLELVLTDQGRSSIEETLFYKDDAPTKLPFHIKVGPIASGNVVVKDGLTWDNLKQWGVRSVLGLEMEAAIIGSTAHRLGVPNWVVAKGVMDHADPRKDDRYKPFAARASAEVLFKFLLTQLITSGSEPKEHISFPSRKQLSEAISDNVTLKREVYRDILRLLNENRVIHDQFGPLSKAGRNITSADGARIWADRKREKIIPNNSKIVDICEKYIHLLDPEEVLVFSKFREHANALEMSSRQRIDLEFQPVFPKEFQTMIEKGV